MAGRVSPPNMFCSALTTTDPTFPQPEKQAGPVTSEDCLIPCPVADSWAGSVLLFTSEDLLAAMAKAHPFNLFNLKLLRLERRTGDQRKGREGRAVRQGLRSALSQRSKWWPVLAACPLFL